MAGVIQGLSDNRKEKLQTIVKKNCSVYININNNLMFPVEAIEQHCMQYIIYDVYVLI